MNRKMHYLLLGGVLIAAASVTLAEPISSSPVKLLEQQMDSVTAAGMAAYAEAQASGSRVDAKTLTRANESIAIGIGRAIAVGPDPEASVKASTTGGKEVINRNIQAGNHQVEFAIAVSLSKNNTVRN